MERANNGARQQWSAPKHGARDGEPGAGRQKGSQENDARRKAQNGAGARPPPSRASNMAGPRGPERRAAKRLEAQDFLAQFGRHERAREGAGAALHVEIAPERRRLDLGDAARQQQHPPALRVAQADPRRGDGREMGVVLPDDPAAGREQPHVLRRRERLLRRKLGAAKEHLVVGVVVAALLMVEDHAHARRRLDLVERLRAVAREKERLEAPAPVNLRDRRVEMARRHIGRLDGLVAAAEMDAERRLADAEPRPRRLDLVGDPRREGDDAALGGERRVGRVVGEAQERLVLRARRIVEGFGGQRLRRRRRALRRKSLAIGRIVVTREHRAPPRRQRELKPHDAMRDLAAIADRNLLDQEKAVGLLKLQAVEGVVDKLGGEIRHMRPPKRNPPAARAGATPFPIRRACGNHPSSPRNSKRLRAGPARSSESEGVFRKRASPSRRAVAIMRRGRPGRPGAGGAAPFNLATGSRWAALF
ncbi:hypothetical protein [Methylocella sp.]|uniref:hypothetical protein n=1 Tax=Methylocella sp. TaxID=1978226 RepID=UPI003783B26E